MKRLFAFLNAFQSLYVVVTSLLGFSLVMLLFVWTFPVPGDAIGKKFTQDLSYPIWVLEFGTLVAFLTVVLLPLWREFVELHREQTNGREVTYNSRLRVVIIACSMAFTVSWLFFIQLTTLNSFTTSDSWPKFLVERLVVVYTYIFIVLLPIPLTNLLIHGAVSEKIKELASSDQDEKKLFKVAYDLLRYRNLLQNGLLAMGIIASAVPVTAATLRSLAIALDKGIAETFPLIGVIAYGLGFSAMLILFYAPTYLFLAQAARVLQDKLCPINNFVDLETNLKRRKDLDEWLHINMSLTDNLKAGIITLAPLATSFITTILGIKL